MSTSNLLASPADLAEMLAKVSQGDRAAFDRRHLVIDDLQHAA